MNFFGVSIGELAALLTVLGIIISFVMYLLKVIVITPLTAQIMSLKNVISDLNEKMDKSEEDKSELKRELEKIKVDFLAFKSTTKEQIKSIFANLEEIKEKLK
ncbi:hypothetical protein P7H75_05915 [Vagococcus carniphilus]|uniref:hypothetical protein n=1 Tax=Vagococcus carniphilus TaxID=218144 RepID=UPI00288F45C0|nr:hypothetical protein [Vagococcus carniphilus]MDT2814376.1 hypothetical protein [Vagococcus carniphilus]